MTENTAENHRCDIAVIGGGLVGLSAAFHLADSKRAVAVISGTRKGKASDAAAGMLTPACEWCPDASPAILEFLRSGREYYDDFLKSLLGSADRYQQVNYLLKQFLLLSLLEDEADLMPRFRKLTELQTQAEWLTPAEVYRSEPNINPDALHGAILISGDGVINPRALQHVLTEHLARRNAAIVLANVAAVSEQGSDFALALDDGRNIVCPRVIIAAGVWSFEVANKFGLDVPVTFSKGQTIELAGPPGLLRRVLYMPVGACGCLLERSPGRYIAGTSEEYTSPEVSNTSKIVAAILGRINAIFRPAGDFAISDMWSGFRPLTPDELPIIGITSDPRVLVATGHYRNGVLLSPLTGLIVKRLVEGQDPPLDIAAFRCERGFQPQYRFASAF